MPDLTPERIRDAAKVLRLLDTDRRHGDPEYSWMPSQVDARANLLERELAEAEAKREKRIEELARELYVAGQTHPDAGKWWDDIQVNKDPWTRATRALIDRHPALAEPDCGHPNHGGNNHDCAPFRSTDA